MFESHVQNDWSVFCQQIAYAATVNNRRLERTFNVFRRRESNNIINFSDERGACRHDFNEPIILALSPGEYEGFAKPVQLAVNGWTVNLSKSGLGVVCGRTLYPVCGIGDETPLIATNEVIHLGSELRVVFLRDGYEVKGLLAEVVRFHDTCEELFDIGLSFCDVENQTECPCRSLEPFVEWLQPYATMEPEDE